MEYTNNLTDEQTTKLNALRLYGTAYEIAVVGDSSKYLVGYGRKSKSGILRMIEGNDYQAVYQMSKLLQVDPESWTVKGDKIAQSGQWKIIATGRTERESIIEGELLSIYEG